MRIRMNLVAAIAVTTVGALAGPAAARVSSVQEAMDSSPKLQLEVPKAETFELENGIRVWYLRNDRLPLVTVRAVVRAGSIWEDRDKQGVANLTGAMMRTGGTSKWSPDELDEELDFLAAELGSNIGAEQGNVALNVHSDNLEAALEIFADVLVHPTFDVTRMDVQKNLVKEQIRRQNDNPVQVGIREFRKLVWGPTHPRASTPTVESVDALERRDLAAYHARFVRPSSVMIGVAGNVSKKDVKTMLNRALGGWEAEPTTYPEVPEPPAIQPRVAFAAKSVPQTTVLMGHLGPRESDPNRAAGEVMMHILGSGGFTSYITDRIRNDEGLAYVAAGVLRFGLMDPGLFIGFALSKSETTCQAADLLLEQMHRIQNVPVTDVELKRSREALLNSQAFDYDSPGKVVNRLMTLVYYDLPADHDQLVMESIARVSKNDIQQAARDILQTESLSCFAVGDPGTMDCEWGRFAEQLGVDLVEIELE